MGGTAPAAGLGLQGCWASAEVLILPVLSIHRDSATLFGLSNAFYISVLQLNQYHFTEEVKFCLSKMKSAGLLPATVVPSCCLKNNETLAY